MRFLFCTSPARAARAAQSGFTLIELLVVLAIIAAVAGVGMQVFTGVTEDSERALARAEMDNISSAIQRFHRDTGYWPKQGRFAADNSANFAHPANLAQLRLQPSDASGAILPWDAASGTGWHGPYLRELDAAQVTVGPMAVDGSGNPGDGTPIGVSGFGDSFAAEAKGAGIYQWKNGAGDVIAQLGRPYLYFSDASANYNPTAPSGVVGCQVPCLVSLGPNGEYNQGGGDDIVVNIAGHQ